MCIVCECGRCWVRARWASAAGEAHIVHGSVEIEKTGNPVYGTAPYTSGDGDGRKGSGSDGGGGDDGDGGDRR